MTPSSLVFDANNFELFLSLSTTRFSDTVHRHCRPHISNSLRLDANNFQTFPLFTTSVLRHVVPTFQDQFPRLDAEPTFELSLFSLQDLRHCRPTFPKISSSSWCEQHQTFPLFTAGSTTLSSPHFQDQFLVPMQAAFELFLFSLPGFHDTVVPTFSKNIPDA
ncbi:unnamed protein product [Acanthosepion pharaonis]|uniref:Uncharacterized protein n=1 Tax=Acanthosepion pharaonis TaxID=158019 RepID=A0A812CTX8_ACAPH|nr:unnamed protein product [Sepia pharaonis]